MHWACKIKWGAAAALVAVLALSGCGGNNDLLGLKDKKPPDEFAVYSRAPLSLPPDYGLRPPQPGAARPQTVAPRNDARRAVFGGTQAQPAPAGSSPGLQALLADTGALEADPSIRATVNRETSVLAEEDKSFTDRLIFWSSDSAEYGKVVDPKAEAKRIQENQALGQALTTGETPTIEKKRRALFEGIF